MRHFILKKDGRKITLSFLAVEVPCHLYLFSELMALVSREENPNINTCHFRHTLLIGINHYKESKRRTGLIKKSVAGATYGPVSIPTNDKAILNSKLQLLQCSQAPGVTVILMLLF